MHNPKALYKERKMSPTRQFKTVQIFSAAMLCVHMYSFYYLESFICRLPLKIYIQA